MSTVSPTAEVDEERAGWTSRLASAPWPELAAPIGLVVLVVIFGLLDSTFVSGGNIEAMLQASAILVVLAVGQTFVVATAGIDLSMASVMTLGAIVLGLTLQATDNIALAIVAGILASGAVGLLNGTIIAKGGITDFIVTLGTLSAASGLALIISDGKPIPVLDRFMLKLASGGVGPFSWSVIVAAIVAVVAHIALFNSRFGLHVLATGGSDESARAVGVRTARVKIAVYTLSGLLAGVAAVLLVARVGAAEPASNTSFLLNSVAAVVLGGVSLFGGRATITGPVMGALLLTALVNGLTLLGLSQFYQPLAVGIVVVLAALLTRFQK
ncbi:MAG: ABC transporter permease [Micrococcales bacterium]|nr:ABC transporter permease [Micrococcales bacterium]